MSRLELRGTEALTLEVELTCAVEAARRLLPAALAPVVDAEGRARASLLLFAMEGMRVVGLPGPRLAYREALWRLRVRRDGEEAWFAAACDLDQPLVRAVGASLIRYPVRRARCDFGAGATPRFSVVAAGEALELVARPGTTRLEAVPPLPVFTAAGGALFRIPWRETPGPERVEAEVAVRADSLAVATLGSVRWATGAALMRGRTHHCGAAERV